jgi:hypothetical protein
MFYNQTNDAAYQYPIDEDLNFGPKSRKHKKY